MSESNEVAVVEPEVVEPSPVEAQASEMGWKPKDEWVKDGGNPDEWRSAREFVDRGELYKSLHSLKRELRAEKEARTALQFHHKRVYESAYNKAVNDLKLQKRAAMRAEDLEAVEAIDEQIEKVQTEHAQLQQSEAIVQKANQGPAPEFQAWIAENSWYEQDEELHDYADAQGIIYLNKNPNAAPEQVLRAVSEKVKKAYPSKFGGRTTAPNPVATPRRQSKATSDVELTEDELTVMRALVKSGDFTEAEYRAEIKKMRG